MVRGQASAPKDRIQIKHAIRSAKNQSAKFKSGASQEQQTKKTIANEDGESTKISGINGAYPLPARCSFEEEQDVRPEANV